MNGSSPQRSFPQGSGQRARGDAPSKGWRAAVARATEDPQLGLISFFAARNRVMMADQFDPPAQPVGDRRGAVHD